jgi:phage shock protein PspC (stress-responsive transcriptional regulator)
MANNKLVRSHNRVIAGVIAGVAEWLGWDVTLTRLLYLLLTLFTGVVAGIVAYTILWIMMPEKEDMFF